jgi:flagellar biosynthetic protein FliR
VNELAGLPALAFVFALVLCRTSAAVMLLPGVGEAELPATIRAGFALSLSLLLTPVVAPLMPDEPVASTAAGMVAAELLTGVALGWLARLPTMALTMAGAVMSTMMGLSSVVQPDPALGGQSSALARALGMAAPVLVLSTGLYAMPLTALAHSYQMMPPGAWLPAGPLAESVRQAASASIELSLRLSAPFILAGLLVQAAMGLLARLAPQLQVFSIAAPGQILGGVVLLGLLAAPIFTAWSEAVLAAWSGLPGS